MEEDRERVSSTQREQLYKYSTHFQQHKRLKEEIWIRPPEESSDNEFEEFWNSTEALDPETDYEVMMMQNMLRLPHYSWNIMLSQRSASLTQQ